MTLQVTMDRCLSFFLIPTWCRLIAGVPAGRNQTSGGPLGQQGAGGPEELLRSSEEPRLRQIHG